MFNDIAILIADTSFARFHESVASFVFRANVTVDPGPTFVAFALGAISHWPIAASSKRATYCRDRKSQYSRDVSSLPIRWVTVTSGGRSRERTRFEAVVAAEAFRALAARGINIQLITTSEIKISILIDAAYTELAVRTLHSIYDLDKT